MYKDKIHELVDALPEHHVHTVESFLEFLVEKKVEEKDNDLEILNHNSDYLNEEAADVLTYQAIL